MRLRTVSAACYNVCVQAGTVISTHIYQPSDAPYYHYGNRVLIGIAVYNVFLFAGTKVFYVWVNKRRATKWDAMTGEERAHYLATTTDKVRVRGMFDSVIGRLMRLEGEQEAGLPFRPLSCYKGLSPRQDLYVRNTTELTFCVLASF